MKQVVERKRNRLEGYDYSLEGAYFITICTDKKSKVFWEYKKDPCKKLSPIDTFGENDVDFSEAGKIVDNEINRISTVYEGVDIVKYCIMPDHIHMIIVLSGGIDVSKPSVSRVINQFKGAVSKKLGVSIWQRSFHDRIIRGEKELQDCWKYIDMNMLKWAWDEHGTTF